MPGAGAPYAVLGAAGSIVIGGIIGIIGIIPRSYSQLQVIGNGFKLVLEVSMVWVLYV